MIPKIIHYCWFGGGKKSKLAKKCIRSWKKYCRDYELIEWNEKNFDIASAPLYVQQAYKAQKWAFVTDYVRLYVVYHYGGIYLDVDVEILRDIDSLLKVNAFFGKEDGGYVATGLGFGAVQNHPILAELMEQYRGISFIKENGKFDDTPCPVRDTEVFIRKGMTRDNYIQKLDDCVVVYSQEYFSPKNYRTGQVTITENTYTIHYYDASWIPKSIKKEREKKLRQKKRKETYKKIRARIKGIIKGRIISWNQKG